jgi:hypothetical protein
LVEGIFFQDLQLMTFMQILKSYEQY